MSTKLVELTPELANRISNLAKGEYRPEPIRLLKAEIEAKTAVAVLVRGHNAHWDQEMISSIVEMKRRLDGLYYLWATGDID